MKPEEFAEMVEFIEDRWGRSDAWANSHNIVGDFAKLDPFAVWEALHARITGDPDKAKYPPKPAELIALSLERMRTRKVPELPETTEVYGWAQWSQEHYGEVVSLADAVERRHAELVAEGKAVAGAKPKDEQMYAGESRPDEPEHAREEGKSI